MNVKDKRICGSEVAGKISASCGIPQAQAGRILRSLLGSIASSLEDGSTVWLAGLGSLRPVQRKARIGRNPATGEEIKIPARKGIRFIPCKALRRGLNG